MQQMITVVAHALLCKYLVYFVYAVRTPHSILHDYTQSVWRRWKGNKLKDRGTQEAVTRASAVGISIAQLA